MAKAIRFHRTGGPEVLQLDEVEVGEPGPGEARVRYSAIGLNFIDVYYRTGLYPVSLPSGLGTEAAGKVLAIGPGVGDIAVGDRVAHVGGPLGAYATERVIAADKLVRLPDAIGDELAAAMMLQGLTAQYLLNRTYAVLPGDSVLIHAAAGGVGQIAVQWAKALGATVIATAGGGAKCERVRSLGADIVIDYTNEDFVAASRAATKGHGVHVVYDGVGKETFLRSLDCLAPLGYMVSYGNASGPPPEISPLLLAQKGSLFLTRPTLGHYTANRAELLAAAEALFAIVKSGKVKIEIGQRYGLADAAQAHADLAARKTTGSSILLPG
jgi:NADPH2:quinone reductase